MTVAIRQKIEREIVTQAVRSGLEAGYTFEIDNGGNEDEVLKSASESDALAEMFATDQEHLYFVKDGKRRGWVLFVYGNDTFRKGSDADVMNPEGKPDETGFVMGTIFDVSQTDEIEVEPAISSRRFDRGGPYESETGETTVSIPATANEPAPEPSRLIFAA